MCQRVRLVIAVVVSVAVLAHGVRVAADPAGDAILADILAKSIQQLARAEQAISELRRSYGEVKRVAEYADDAASAARSFQRFSGRAFGDRFQSDLDATYPDMARFRRDALAASGMGRSPWAEGTETLRRLTSYCLADPSGGR